MIQQKPYQPLLFRVLHGLNGLLVLSALSTGFWVYNTYDGRFGKLPLPQVAEVEGIHGTFGLCFFLALPAFALYSFHAGRHRLIPASHLASSTTRRQIQQRWVNTLMLLSATWSAFSGRLMKEDWIGNGTLLQQPIYYLHLFGWLLMSLGLLFHLWTILTTGGIRLIQSTIDTRVRDQDHPKRWPERLAAWWSQPGTGIGAWWRSLLSQPAFLRTIECVVLGGILLGLIAPIFLSGE